MKLLAGDKGADEAESPPMGPIDDGDDDDTSSAGFNAAADEVFTALESKDVDAFTSALKSCIEMFK